MKHLFAAFLYVTVIIGFAGCKNDVIPSNEDFVIEFGSQCGWCAGEEMISITPYKIEYTRTIPCDENKGITNKSAPITKSKWDSICSSFDYDLFKTLEHNECNFCADGCDEIIRITEDDNTHELRYSPEEEIEGMKKLRQFLGEILSEIQNQD